MGNQLVSSVKTVIRPIDYYLSEVPDIKHKQSLGQTQFLKVALCYHASEGDVVVKVLSHEDPSLLLEPYKSAINRLDAQCSGHASIASFRIAELRPHFAYIVRQYVRFSLYDRLSTRPFLAEIEKYWIVYQLLRAIDWCHSKKIVHGDLKLENILVTSNLWVILADFATYKPVSLPEDNPSFFNYFFDTSRRRCCNIAPERFVPTASLSAMDNLPAPPPSSPTPSATSAEVTQQLTDKMDMFSIGCCLAEIFSDNVLFDLSALLYYKEAKHEERLEAALKKIHPPQIRELVANLISLEPEKRKSARAVLEEMQGGLFPVIFEQLYSLMRTIVRLPPDSKILYLSAELGRLLPAILAETPTAVLILLSTLTSTLRSLTHVHCKIEAQRLIVHLVSSAGSSTLSPYITDRLVPYFAWALAHESDHRVRGEAIISLTRLLAEVQVIPGSDSNIFTDYLLEILIRSLEAEKSTYVRLCMASNVGQLSQIAIHFLNSSCDANYAEELAMLHSSFTSLVVQLLTDANSCVRRALLLTPTHCTHLCTFFGRQKTNDVILPHIFTFLNVKNDFQLRLAFFDNIIVIAAYLGVQCSTILHPLLQQGLCDAEEVVIWKTINSVGSLVEQGLLQKNIIYELLREICPLLYHPNSWIIHSIVHLFTILSTTLSPIDLHCKVLPLLGPYLNRPLHSLSNKYLVLDCLQPPINRHIFDIVLESKDSSGLFECLRASSGRAGSRTASALKNQAYRRLEAENVGQFVESQLLTLADLLLKIHRNRRNYLTTARQHRDDLGSEIVYNDYEKLVRSVNLVDSFSVEGTTTSGANQEWQHMFGPNSASPRGQGQLRDQSDTTIADATEVREMEYVFFECPPCGRDVRVLMAHKKNGYSPATSRPNGGNGGTATTPTSSFNFRPRGFLVSHLYEHRSAVTGMTRYAGSSCFFTCSDDGTIRLWDLAHFESRHVINRSKLMFKMEFSNGAPINFKGVISVGGYVVSYSTEGIIYVFEPTDARLELLCSFKPGQASKSVAIPVLITSLTALSSNIFAVSLTNSVIYGYDIRSIHSVNFFVPVFKMRLPPSQRTVTSIDGAEVVLFAGTACGYIAGFDMRFSIKVNYFIQTTSSGSPNGTPARVARIKYASEGLYATAYGSTDVTLWDYKIAVRDKVLKTAKIDGHAEDGGNAVVKAILPTSGGVITGGTDQRIRFWDLKQPENSYVISDPILRTCHYLGKVVPPNSSNSSKNTSSSSGSSTSAVQNLYFDHTGPLPMLATYRAHTSGDHMIVEECDASKPYSMCAHYCAIDHQSPQVGHQDAVTELLAINSYLVSSGRNGTVKVWR